MSKLARRLIHKQFILNQQVSSDEWDDLKREDLRDGRDRMTNLISATTELLYRRHKRGGLPFLTSNEDCSIGLKDFINKVNSIVKEWIKPVDFDLSTNIEERLLEGDQLMVDLSEHLPSDLVKLTYEYC